MPRPPAPSVARHVTRLAACAGALLAAACAPEAPAPATETQTEAEAMACDPDDGGLSLPAGFCAVLASEGVGRARHIAVRPDGDVFVARPDDRREGTPGGVVALRDSDGDGRFDVEERWGERGGNGILLDGETLWLAPDDAVLRYRLPAGSLTPEGPPVTVVAGLPSDRSHAAKSIALGGGGALFVNIGAPSNACQEQPRTEGSPGLDPCPQLEDRGGIWRFDASRTDQAQTDGSRFATGLRNVVALTVHPQTDQLWGVQHGRDQLHSLFPDLYSAEDNAELPSEEMVAIDEGDDFGWPYCYHDWRRGAKVLSPEYGGDGSAVGRCADAEDPLVAFPGHWAPNDIVFYDGGQFPERYRGGAFVAFHGSWNRAPLPQEGYKVVFVPFADGRPTGDWEEFADGFREAGAEGGARPVGLALAPDGSLYVVDSNGGRIWRIRYEGT